jgi:CDP-diacylglycerol--glycerol-3-phosphate 3-phosphatidyltransferase
MRDRGASRASAPERVVGRLPLATLPNALSFTRIVLLPPVLYLLDRPDPESDQWAMGLLVVAGMTDLLDGFLARRRGSVSPTGKIVDPLADKILIGGLLIWLVLERAFPAWLVALVLLRDLALVGGAMLFLRRQRLVFPADWSGKLTTFFLGLLVLAYIGQWRDAFLPLTVLATTMLAASYVSYGRRAWNWRAVAADLDG